ncbi:MAG: hypothetical protein R3B06_11870 [Kofleriaceae bacterium]
MDKTDVATPGRRVWASVKKRWRGWVRAIHRDLGYLAVGLTFIYAMSGLAINHINDWDPNFKTYERAQVIAPISADVPDDQAIATARAALKLGTPRSTYRAGDEIHLEYDYKKFVIYGDSGQVTEQGRQPRFLLRVANWLHYNRGKRAWTYVADAYAVLLLYLAVSGLFMIKGRNGLRWRGAILALAGIAVPVGYVVWSGGPEANNRAAAAKAARDDAGPGPDPAPAADGGDEDDPAFARPPIRRQPPAAPAPAPTSDDGPAGGELQGNPLRGDAPSPVAPVPDGAPGAALPAPR